MTLPEAQPTPQPLKLEDEFVCSSCNRLYFIYWDGRGWIHLLKEQRDRSEPSPQTITAAQPTPGWTFVDATKHPHGMPPQYDEVLFSTTYEQVEKGKWNGSESERNRRWQSCEVDSQSDPIFFCDDEVIAWQLLPSPPEPTPKEQK